MSSDWRICSCPDSDAAGAVSTVGAVSTFFGWLVSGGDDVGSRGSFVLLVDGDGSRDGSGGGSGNGDFAGAPKRASRMFAGACWRDNAACFAYCRNCLAGDIVRTGFGAGAGDAAVDDDAADAADAAAAGGAVSSASRVGIAPNDIMPCVDGGGRA